jgi:hypothetical protein
MTHNCKICKKDYKSYKSLWTHNKTFHSNSQPIVNINANQQNINNDKKLICKYCSNIFSFRQSKWRHEKTCKSKIIKGELDSVKEELTLIKKTKNINIPFDSNINSQLINIIMDKNKVIEELKEIPNPLIKIYNENNIEGKIILNNITIISRDEDNYVNATQLCLAGNKNFNDWLALESTKYIINELRNITKILKSQLIESCKEIWIHPDLSIQLAQWLSPVIALQISKWLRSLFINKELLDSIRIKDTRIKLLQDTYLKKHNRVKYPGKYVIYMLTTEDHKKKRLYIVTAA